MILVLCDICRKNTNLTTPIGTLTRIYTGFGNARRIKSTTYESDIQVLFTSSDDNSTEKKHVCAECAIVEQATGSGWAPAKVTPQLSQKETEKR